MLDQPEPTLQLVPTGAGQVHQLACTAFDGRISNEQWRSVFAYSNGAEGAESDA